MGVYQSDEQGTPATPPTNERVFYARSNGYYSLDSNSNEIKIDNAVFGTAAGTNTYTVSISNHSTAAYSSSYLLFIKFTNANTLASTLNVNSIGEIPIKKNVSEALIANDIKAGEIITLAYDGTNFQIAGGNADLQTALDAKKTIATGNNYKFETTG